MDRNHEELKRILAEAAAIADKAEREVYLDKACHGNAQIRARVDQLLKAHDSAGNFLNEPVQITPPQDFIQEAPGTIIGHYKLLEEIGEGGFGVVFMAEQVEPIRRKVALKIVKPGMDTKQVIARFEAERQALAIMEHPNIAQVYDAGTTEAGRPYFVLELVHGVPITNYCDANDLSADERLKLFVQVCSAVQHAHQKGIIHRDLKPSNILVTLHDGKPVPKVIDFGTAKALQEPLTERTLFTAYGRLIGTPQYMSPEQAEFSGLDVDTRADIYSLGVLLYELLTGTTPFEAVQLRAAAFDEMMRIIRQDEPPKPSKRVSTLGQRVTEIAKHRQVDANALQRSLRGDLDWIVMKTLEKDRTRRYETVSDLGEDIQRHLEHHPVLAGPPSTVYRARKFVRRHTVGFALTTCVGLAVVIGLVASLIGFTQAQRERNRAVMAEGVAQEQRALSLQHLYRAHIQLARQDWEHGNLRNMIETLGKHIPKSGELERRGWEWYYLWSLCHNPEGELGRHDHPVTSLALHPNGKWLASSSYSSIKIWDVDSGRPLAELNGHTDWVTSVAWSPDGTLLASGSWDRRMILWSTNGFHRLREFNCADPLLDLQWSPDGKKVAGARSMKRNGDGGGVTIWDATSGQELLWLDGDDWIRSLAWQPQGKMLIAGGNWPGKIQVWDPDEGKLFRTFQAHDHYIQSVAWNPDGRRFASAGEDQSIKIWATDTWTLLLDIDPAHDGLVTCLTWSEDGRTLISGGADGMLKFWDAQSGDLLHVLRAHANGVGAICWSYNHKFLISGGGDGAIRRWRPDEEQSARVVAESGASSWSPDERYLATTRLLTKDHRDGISILDTATWQTLYFLNSPTNSPPHLNQPINSTHFIESMSWSPDGRKLAASCNNSFVQVWDLATRKEIWSWQGGPEPPNEETRCLAWSPDSHLLAVGSSIEEVVRIWDPETGKLLRTLKARSEGAVDGVVWHPDGQRIATRTMDGQLLIWDAGTGEMLREFHCPGWGAGWQNVVQWNPKGTLLAAGCGNGSIRIWDDETGEMVQKLDRHTGSVRSIAWSPDGHRLVSGAEDRTVRLWNVDTGQELMTLPEPNVWLPFITWSPSGRLIAVGSNQLRIYDARAGYELALPTLSTKPPSNSTTEQ